MRAYSSGFNPSSAKGWVVSGFAVAIATVSRANYFTIAFNTEVKKPRPSAVGPVKVSIACSGCGIRPTTLPRSLVIPAILFREPLGFSPT